MAKNWAELPRDLLGRILERLCITNIYSFMNVCEPWYSVVREEADLSWLRPVPSPPWMTIPPPPPQSDEQGEKNGKYFNPANKKVIFSKKEWQVPPPKEAVCVGSSHGWLAFVDFKCVIYLTNPFKPHDESSMIQLPPIETLPCIHGVVGSSSSGVDFLRLNSSRDGTYIAQSNEMYGFFIHKLVLSSAPSSSSDDEPYTVMVIYGNRNELAFCKSGDTSWTTLDGKLKGYNGLYYSSNNQQFHALSRESWSFEIWDLRNFSSPKSTCIIRLPPIVRWIHPSMRTTIDQIIRSRSAEKMYLAEFDGDLLFVVGYAALEVNLDGQIIDEDPTFISGTLDFEKAFPYKTMCFDVYKLDPVKKQWVQVKCLGEDGDGVLFLGMNNPVAFSAREFPGLQSNSIYFTDDNFYRYMFLKAEVCSYGGHDLGIFNLEDNNFQPLYYPEKFFQDFPTTRLDFS